MARFSFVTIFILLILLGTLVYFRYLTPFQVSIQHGILVSVVQRGYVFKTYEGVLILPAALQQGDSTKRELHFSVERASLADSLMHYSGDEVVLKLLTYKGRLPWRGESATIATALLDVEKPDSLEYH